MLYFRSLNNIDYNIAKS